MQVELKNGVFTATQWFKDGDHPAVDYHKATRSKYGSAYDGLAYFTVDTVYDDDAGPPTITPGMWIVEMFDGIHLYTDEEFKKLFVKANLK